MKNLKSLARWFLARSWLAGARYLLWAHYARRDSRATEHFAEQSGVSLAQVFKAPILTSPTTKNLFILGSGSSVNEMTREQFQHVARHESIGINFWFFHDFVPNLFSFDAGRAKPSEQEQGKRSLVTLGRLFNRTSVLAARPKVLYLRPHASDEDFLFPISEDLQSGAWVSGRANMLSLTEAALETDIRVMLRRLTRHALPAAVLPDNGSSVVRLVFLGLSQGYRHIVLCGVDLDSRPHFWMNDDYAERYPEHVKLFPAPDDKLHGTAEARGRPLGNLEFLVLLDRVLREEKVGQLFVGSPSSRLSGLLSPYSWPESGD